MRPLEFRSVQTIPRVDVVEDNHPMSNLQRLENVLRFFASQYDCRCIFNGLILSPLHHDSSRHTSQRMLAKVILYRDGNGFLSNTTALV